MTANTARTTIDRTQLREQIVAISLKEFKERGIKDVTMDDIAALLRISKRTLYEIFSDKEMLLMDCVSASQKEFEDYSRILISSNDNVIDIIRRIYQYEMSRIQSINHKFFSDIKKYPKAYNLLLQKQDQASDMALKLYQDGVEQGIFRQDVNFPIANRLIHDQIRSLLHSDICELYPFMEVLETVIFTFIRGISTEKGIHQLDQLSHK